MNNTFVLRGKKSGHFPRPSGFCVKPTSRGGSNAKSGGHLAKILTTNHFLFFKKYVRTLFLKIGTLFCGPFSLYTISKGRQVQRLASQG